MSYGYLDEMGEYCEPDDGSFRISEKARKQQQSQYWNSLPVEQQDVIKWCRSQNKTRPLLQYGDCRMRAIHDFISKELKLPVPKKDDQYKIVYLNFELFKKFILEKYKP